MKKDRKSFGMRNEHYQFVSKLKAPVRRYQREKKKHGERNGLSKGDIKEMERIFDELFGQLDDE